MPFICLARNDIPDGSVQILDLKPNTSQPQPRTALGQTKYVNRTIRGDALAASGASAISPAAAGYKSNTSNAVSTTEDISGLTAYILDAVQPCNNASSTARIRITAADLNAGDTIVFTTALGAYTLTAVNVAPAANQFQQGAGAATTAANIATAINLAGNQTNCDTAIGFHFTAVAVGVNVDITATVVGQAGSTGLTTNAAARLAFLFGGATNNATYVTTRTRRTAEAWNVNLINRVTANIQAAVDSGAALTPIALATLCSPTIATTGVTAASPAVFTTASAHGLTTGDSVWISGQGGGGKEANINNRNWIVTAASATTFSIDFDNTGGTAAVGAATVDYAFNTSFLAGEAQLLVLTDLLKILSGTGYKLPSSTTLYSALSIGGGVNTQDFHAALAGSFVEDVTGTIPAGGGYWQTDANPIPVILPIHPTRPTYSGAAFNMSISQGVLQQLAAGPTWNLNTRSFMNSESGTSGRALTLAGTPIRGYAYQGNRGNLRQGFAAANPSGLTSLSGLRIVTVYDDAGNVLV